MQASHPYPECHLCQLPVSLFPCDGASGLTAEGNIDSMCSPQKVLSKGSNLPTVADGDWTIISVSIVVNWLLVIFKLQKSCYWYYFFSGAGHEPVS
jgi:hypothetical protein